MTGTEVETEPVLGVDPTDDIGDALREAVRERQDVVSEYESDGGDAAELGRTGGRLRALAGVAAAVRIGDGTEPEAAVEWAGRGVESVEGDARGEEQLTEAPEPELADIETEVSVGTALDTVRRDSDGEPDLEAQSREGPRSVRESRPAKERTTVARRLARGVETRRRGVEARVVTADTPSGEERQRA